jgi:hypothetical protein
MRWLGGVNFRKFRRRAPIKISVVAARPLPQ